MTWATIRAALVTWLRASSGLDAEHVFWSQAGRPRPSGRYVEIRARRVKGIGRDWVDAAATPLVIPDDAVESVSTVDDTLTLTAHGLTTGDGPVRFTTSGTLPAPLAVATDYWVVRLDANRIKLATTHANAIATVPVVVDLTTAGTGTHTLVDTASTVRQGQELTHTARGVRDVAVEIQCFEGIGVSTADSPVDVLDQALLKARLPTQAAAFRAAGLGLGKVGDVLALDGDLGFTVFEPRAVVEVRFHATAEATELGTVIETVRATHEIPDPDSTFTIGA
jgi:hypothetical protein